MQTFKIAIENGDEHRAVAWVQDQLGCFAYGPDPATALAAAPAAIQEYIQWVKAHASGGWLEDAGFKTQMVETWQVYFINEQYEETNDESGYAVNAWFRHDAKPLTAEEIQRGLQILTWTREDLFNTVENLSIEKLNRTYTGERWSIDGVLQHVAGAEWWYLDRLDLAFPREQLVEDTDERLQQVRNCLVETLLKLEGKNMLIGKYAEFWSPRKLLRRAAWHERDHTDHIRKLIKA